MFARRYGIRPWEVEALTPAEYKRITEHWSAEVKASEKGLRGGG